MRLTRQELGALLGAVTAAYLGTLNADAGVRARTLAISERVQQAWCRAARERRPFVIEVVEV